MIKQDLSPGITCANGVTTFCVFAPYAHAVSLQLYASDSAARWAIKKSLAPNGDGFFSCALRGNFGGLYYTYAIDGVETIDPYALSGGANSVRGYILADGAADPDGWENDNFTPSPPIVWEIHVRDFSSDKWLNLPDAGKFTAFREGVSTPDGKPALIDYLKYLGITYVQLMPVADYGSVDELAGGYNWGYDPVCYFMPEGSYSSDPHNGLSRVRELKTLVKNLHDAGIGVILDVVFNHTYKKEGNPLDICAPDYYYRLRGKELANGSGCGNETRSESEMFRKLIIDCVCHYVKEYHVDGFRFDLMGLHDVETMNCVRRALDNIYPDGRGKQILLYGEPWYVEPPDRVEGADKAHFFKLDERVGMFNDSTRNGIRGLHFVNVTGGYVQGRIQCLEEAMSGISGGNPQNPEYMRVKSPVQQVLYTACHDDYTLYDQICMTTDVNENRRAMHRMADFMVFSGLGIPFMLAGQEFYRTKGGDGNSYKSGDAVNKLDWRRMSAEWDGVNYYKGLIELRKSNPVFENLAVSRANFRRLESPEGVAAYMVGNVVYGVNATENDAVVPICGAKISQVCDIDRAGTMPFAEHSGEIKIKARNVFAGYVKTD